MWGERDVDTNGIGTTLEIGAPVHIHAAEHYRLRQHQWSCAASPVLDPRTSRIVRAIDLSFTADSACPTAVALASSLARQAEFALRAAHLRRLEKLHHTTNRLRIRGPWVLVDRWGRVADSSGVTVADRLPVPEAPARGMVVSGQGATRLEPVDGRWLPLPRGDHPRKG
ncbi:hypothetical protein [Cutibacterium sp. V947]|uniref:hypothetical protein n=1 Tax=Cutibacterium sp. V947 TaxID=3446480 RepID=UPI003EE12723